MNSSNAKKPSYGGLKSIVFIHKPSLLNNLSSITQRTISRFKGDYSKIKSLLIFLIILFITQETKAVDCTGKPAYYYNAAWNVHYWVGIQMTHGGKLYQLHTHASYGQFSPTSGTGVHYWTDLGTCVSCSVGSASSSPSVAKDNAMTNITHATSGVTGITSSSGLPSGVTASYSSDVLTISGTPTATGTFNYTIDLDGCGDDATGTITVTSCAGTASSSPAVALNAAMTNITHTTTGVSGITSSSGLPSGVSSSYSSNTLTISGTPTATGTFNYTIDLTGCSDDATGTITVFAPPGGVSDDLHLWLKADAQTFSDAGSTASTDGTEVQEWHDQSGNSFDATDNGGTGPDWDEDALNFNPGIDFVSASSEDLEIANGILESENKSSLFHYYVLKVDESQNNGLFRENLGGSNYYEALFWASGSWYGSYGNNVNGEGRIVQNWGANHGEWHLWGWGTSNSLLTPTSTRRYLMRDNTVIDSDNSNTNVGGTGQNNTFYLGSRAAGSYLDGTLCELIIYDGVPTETEEDQIQTYLAVKYGLTLAGEDYMHSDGSTVIWDYSSYTAYHNGIAGIGRDDNSGLHQKQSKSTNYGTVLTISTEAIAATNTANGTSLTDGTYLLWGHNNSHSSGYADLPTSGGYTGRLQKEWVVEMTGTVSNIHVEFDLSDAHLNLAGDAASDFYLLTDADGDFTSGATATAASSFSGNKVTFDDFNFSDGQYFTLATKQSAPGGIASGLHLWYNASTQSHNTGTTQATDGQDVNNWHDQSGNNFDANSNQGDASYHENGMNFNPTLTFDGTGENYTVSGGIIGDDDTLHNMFVYFAGTVSSTGAGRTVFNENTLNHTSDTYEVLMNRSSTANLTLDKGQHTTGTGRVAGTLSETVDKPHIISACSGETTSTPQGTNKYITRDNTVVDTQDGTSNAEGNGDDFYLGSNDANGNDWHGNMSELIILNTIPTATEEDQIQSYLAVKYGITLASMNYLSSSGTVIWNNSTYSSYHYDIAGIGRDDLSGLHQKQSKSANSDAIVTMSTEAIGTTNAGISTSLTDGAYLLWGNNNASTSANTDLPSGYNGRLQKEWVVEMTGTVADVHIEFDINGLGLTGNTAGDFTLLRDADGDFTSGASTVTASSFTGGKVTFDDIDFTDGQYFTLASSANAPGGVTANLQYWIKADAGTNTTSDEAEVTSWTDQSANATSNTGSGGTAPTYETDGINFNHTINFNGSDEIITIGDVSNLPSGDETRTYFSIVKPTSTSDGTVWSHGNAATNEAQGLFIAGSGTQAWYYGWSADFSSAGFFSTNLPVLATNYYDASEVAYIVQNGEQTATASKTAWNTNNVSGSIGGRLNGGYHWTGDISEVIMYDTELSTLERLQVETYLALKYGISLTSDNDGDASAGETISGSVTEGDYVASDGSTIIWDYSSHTGYHYDITGIGRDETGGSDLHQKQSKSINTDAIVTMSTEAIAADNSSNGTSLTEDAYLLWGNNNASTSANTDLPSGYTGRLEKEWVVEMTGTVSNVHVEFDISSSGLAGDAAADYYLLVDADGDFTSGASATVASSFSTGKVTFDDVNFTDGQYFTLATQQAAPGAVASNLHLWLKADAQTFSDAGSTASADGTEVQEWHDQSGNSFDADDSGGNGPDWDADGINFNPTLDFTGGASGEPLDIPNGIMEGGTKTDMYVYSVVTTDVTQEQALFWQDLNTSNTTEVFSFIPHFNGGWSYWDNGYANGGMRAGPAQSGITLGQPHLFSLSSTTNYMEIKRDNNSVATSTDNGSPTEDHTQPFYIGYRWNNSGTYFDGKLSELIIYDGVPTSTEEDQIESYLAVKYGITLASTNYLSSDGTVIWNNSTYSSYHYDIAGIGRDDNQGLHQKQSKSINSDAIVTVSTEAIGTTNAGISTALTDGAYLLWGNNNSTSNTYDDLPAGYSGRLKKEWVVEMTGTVENVHVEFDITDHDYLGGDAAADFYLITDADGDFTSGASETVASSFSSNKVTFDDIDFTDGQYFTLGTKQPGPGGVANNVLLWLKADAGTNTTTNDERVTSWVSQGTSSFTANEVSSDGPTYKTDGINGHPALDFSDNRMNITGGICEGETKDDIFVYVVSLPRSVNSQRVIFWQNLNSSRYLLLRQYSSDFAIQFIYGENYVSYGSAWANSATAGIVADQAHLWAVGSTTGAANTTPNGTRRYIKRNGVVVDSDDNSARTSGTSTNDFQIGHHADASLYDGLIAEIIILDETPTAKQDNRIRSYLNNKYGLTNGATSQDRINSNGTTIWPYNASYNTNIAGIKRDDLSGVDEKQAKSILSGAVVTMSTQAIAATNAANTTSLGVDKSALVWGNDAGSVAKQTTELHSDFSERMGREWLVRESGTVGNVVVEVDLTGVSFSNTHVKNFALVIDDDGTFTGGTQSWVAASTYASDKVTFDAVDFSDGKYFTVMNTPNALPVELTYFEGKRIGSHVLLEWETMAEVNNDYFIVQKSYDGENWEEILTVDGQGNSSEPTYYSQIDIDGCEGVCYYKLIQVDFGGESKEEKIVAINSGGYNTEFKISVSPNPINQIANIAFSAPEGGMFNLTVTNQAGQVMYTAKTIGDKGNNHIAYNAARLPKGSYYFILEDENGNRTQQLVIK